jgi:signal transduction histidine kinase
MKSHKIEEGECQINSFINGQIGVFKFKIICQPFETDDDFYVITNLAEIRGDQEKIDQLLEKTKTDKPANLDALAEMIEKVEEKGKLEVFTETLAQANSPINENLIDRRQLNYAETNKLKVYITPVNAYKLLLKTVHNMRCHDAAQGKEIKIAPPFPPASVDTDAALLQQILRNMMKNALEATPLQGTIHIGYEKNASSLTFYVFNESVIPEKVQQHIFERSFTTKEKAKGLGTYGMKLLGEHYLNGIVGFESAEGMGTRFFISLPLSAQMVPETPIAGETAFSNSLSGEWIDPVKDDEENTVLSIDDLIAELSKINRHN